MVVVLLFFFSLILLVCCLLFRQELEGEEKNMVCRKTRNRFFDKKRNNVNGIPLRIFELIISENSLVKQFLLVSFNLEYTIWFAFRHMYIRMVVIDLTHVFLCVPKLDWKKNGNGRGYNMADEFKSIYDSSSALIQINGKSL